jgi:CheY-like chemotaxis protein/anti-sigma regulatory factor (Ser/Thr protein kinase)
MGTTRVLAVDDDPLHLFVLIKVLTKAGFETRTATDGTEALALLEAEPDSFDVLLLDLALPGLNGLQLLHHLKAHPRLKHIPVILQTASLSADDIAEGLQAGAYYYLTKPLTARLVQAVVRAAAEDYERHKELHAQVEAAGCPLAMMAEGRFCFRTLAECHELANLLAKICPDPARIVTGLSELLINALEHGNLGITYQDKTRLLEAHTWREEVNLRQGLAENRDKRVQVNVRRLPDRVRFEVTDEGPGFQWQSYLTPDPSRLFDNHGRGIFMARADSFDHLEYLGTGNQVVAEVML